MHLPGDCALYYVNHCYLLKQFGTTSTFSEVYFILHITAAYSNYLLYVVMIYQ